MLNPFPSAVGAEGFAPAAPRSFEPEAWFAPNKRCARGTSCSAVSIQFGLDIVAPMPFPVANDCVKSIEPKMVSAICWQKSLTLHCEGASAIHSAEVRSGLAILRL